VGAQAITRREAEVLEAVQRHLTNAEIADQLCVSIRTVESHVASLIRKLDVANRRELARLRRAPHAHLPSAASSFVGRTSEIQAVDEALSAYRLVSLVGPGGVGKTRLAIAGAERSSTRFEGGVWFVELASVRDPAIVESTVAGTLGISQQDGDLVDAIATALASRPPSLLILDNCEHLLVAAAALAVRLAAVTGVRVLATSREALGVDGERIMPVSPLPEDESTQLFAERAALVSPVSASDSDAIARICRRLDHLPLAIELAAAQTRVAALAELEHRLDERLLQLPRRGGPSSIHESMAGAVAWSFNRLSPDAQRVFSRLCVFAGPFSLEAAEAVCASSSLAAEDVLRAVGELVDRSMLVRQDGANRVLEPLRLFGLERLGDDTEDARHAHARYYLALASAVEPSLIGPDEATSMARLRGEDANIRGAITWARERDVSLAHALVRALWRYWSNSLQHRTALPLVEPLLNSTGDTAALERAWTLTVAASLAAEVGEPGSASSWADEAMATFEQAGDTYGLACALLARSWMLDTIGELDQAEELLARALAMAESLRDEKLKGLVLECSAHVASVRGNYAAATLWSERELAAWTNVGSRIQLGWTYRNLSYAARADGRLSEAATFADRALAGLGDDEGAAAHIRNTMADIARLQGHTDDAIRIYEDAIAGFASCGDRRCLAASQKNLAQLAMQGGDLGQARRLFVDSLRVRTQLRDALGVAECLDGLAGVAHATGRSTHAVSLLAAAHTRRASSGSEQLPEDRGETQRLQTSLRAEMTPDEFEQAWNEGAALDDESAVGRAQLV
jgi:predicted ATPase/DNA-binding CsgD family transcriptional regulator